ncbi:unnamed protein product, partial [Sphagnum balticum]
PTVAPVTPVVDPATPADPAAPADPSSAVLKTGKFIMYGPVTTSFRLLSLTLTATTTRVGVVTANTAEGSTCSITPRLQATANIYSGLTFNSTYYIGNNGQPSLQQSTVNQ